MKVTILDTFTGKQTSSAHLCSGMSGNWWAWGNGSCDCNRALCFDIQLEECSENRFLIIAATPETPEDEGYGLSELNDGYPLELVKKYVTEKA